MISSHNKAVGIPWFLRKSETSSNYTRSQWIETTSEAVFLTETLELRFHDNLSNLLIE